MQINEVHPTVRLTKSILQKKPKTRVYAEGFYLYEIQK